MSPLYYSQRVTTSTYVSPDPRRSPRAVQDDGHGAGYTVVLAMRSDDGYEHEEHNDDEEDDGEHELGEEQDNDNEHEVGEGDEE